MDEAPGTLRVRSLGASVTRHPGPGRRVVFGRGQREPNLLVGGDDPGVSREHGVLAYRDGRWWVHNVGKQSIRIADNWLLSRDDDPVPLAPGVTALVVHGSSGREHPVEVHVAGDGAGRRPRPGEPTRNPRPWPLSADERTALIVLGQRYLYREPRPQPLSWRMTTEQLVELQPERRWTQKRVEHLVLAVRQRLSVGGVAGLTLEEVGEPVGNTLNHNLLQELLLSGTLRPRDVDVLDR